MEEQRQPPALVSSPLPSSSTSTSSSRSPWLASRLLQRQVVNVSTLEPLGRVVDVLFDPGYNQLAGIVVQSERAPGGVVSALDRVFRRRSDIGAVPLDHLVSLNGDVVMVSADPVRHDTSSMFEGALSLNEVCDLVILTTYGMSLGSLTDVLLENLGGALAGYVVKPTEVAESSLPLLADLAEPDADERDTEDATEADGLSALASSRLRVIPASAHVRFGETLIMLVSEVEPLQPRAVVVSQQPPLQVDSAGLLRNLKKKWMSLS